ncbi:MAG: response regulator [Candidatus Sumerlaeia bacterium]|nr:response regulator [Candidatus Sumerlaeia bacterium]
MGETFGTEYDFTRNQTIPNRILVVDDESVVCVMVSGILVNAGFTCDIALSENEALQHLASGCYTCLISDIRMPGIGGVELIKRARAMDRDLEIILMTGLVDAATARAALKTDARDCLVKPFEAEELVHTVVNALEHRRLVLENRYYQQHLEEKVAQQAEMIRSQFLAAIRSLAKAEEARDEYTRGHSDRVSDLALMIARTMGIPYQERSMIQLAGLLHDVGKIGVPDQILLKPGALTAPEWQIMKMHPVIGRDIIAQIDPPPLLIEGILQHHERWDGKGYPEGRSKTGIAQIGRILAVADCFDAMTSARPYRPAFSTEEALDRIRQARETQLDPEATDAFLYAIERRQNQTPLPVETPAPAVPNLQAALCIA